MIEYWTRDASGSTEQRKWFDHDLERQYRVRRRYREEVQSTGQKPLPDEIARLVEEDSVTLLYGAEEHR